MKLYALQVAVYAILSSATAQAETGIVLDQKPSILKANSHSTMKADIARALSKRSVEETENWDRRTIFNAISSTVIAKGFLGMDIKKEEDYILSDKMYVFSKLGSTFTALPFCKKFGDYDFAGRPTEDGLFYPQKNNINFSKAAMDKIVEELLVARGAGATRNKTLESAVFMRRLKNHVLMIEISKYLTNQLLAERYPENDLYDNDKNDEKLAFGSFSPFSDGIFRRI